MRITEWLFLRYLTIEFLINSMINKNNDHDMYRLKKTNISTIRNTSFDYNITTLLSIIVEI